MHSFLLIIYWNTKMSSISNYITNSERYRGIDTVVFGGYEVFIF